MNTKHNQESKTNSNQNVLSHISNGYVDHSFALKDRETPSYETTNTVLLKGNTPNFTASDGKPEYIQYPYPINDCDKIQAQSIHKVCPKQNESHGMSSDRNTYYAQNSLADENGYIGLPFEEKIYDINCEKDEVDKLETDIRIPSRGYVAADCISDIKHMTDVTTSKEHYNIFPQNESKNDNDIEITPYSMNDFPHKADNSGYVKDKNINHMFEYDAASNAMSLNGNFSHSGVKNGYIAFPLDRIVETAAGSTDSGISASVENISCFDSSEKEGSRSVANEAGNNSNLVSHEKDMHSVTSNGLRIGYCRVAKLYVFQHDVRPVVTGVHTI
ncbi:hypothetical protein SK128_019139 [Halocaridina rubra]|uniref:Uncharacterized protein n=1 Tax=Halocaridina rubra TaxID=373956 RepID=A0AAN9ADS0_HALRR